MSERKRGAAPGATMRAFQLVRPGKLQLRQLEIPAPADGEVLARVSLALTCATDLKTYERGHARLAAEGPIGHEWAGRVEMVGPGVRTFRPGDRMVATPTVPCGDCAYCLRGAENLCLHLFEHPALGAYAEYVLIPRQIVNRHAFAIPEGVTDERAAFLEPLACVVHGADLVHLSGDRSVVFLGDGAMVLLFVQVARRRGAGRIVVVGRHAARLELAKRLGADVVVDGRAEDARAAVLAQSDGLGADTVVECVGRPEAWQEAVGLARRGGELLFFGGCERGSAVTLETERVHYDEVALRGGFHYTPASVRRAWELICRNALALDPLVTHRLPLEELPEALALMRRREAIKVAIVP